MRWFKVRYSLRMLLLLVPLVGTALYWVQTPTWQAERFVTAVNRRNFDAAEQLCRDPADAFPGSWRQQTYFEPKASLKPRAWSDLAQGERQIVIGVHYGDGGGIASCTVECQATRKGITIGMAFP